MATYTVQYTVYHEIEVDGDQLAISIGRHPLGQDIRNQAFNQLTSDTGNIVFGGIKKNVSVEIAPRKVIRSTQSY